MGHKHQIYLISILSKTMKIKKTFRSYNKPMFDIIRKSVEKTIVSAIRV